VYNWIEAGASTIQHKGKCNQQGRHAESAHESLLETSHESRFILSRGVVQ
jgi:hypothetical protein